MNIPPRKSRSLSAIDTIPFNQTAVSLLFLLSGVAGALAQQPAPADPLVAKALAIHERAVTLDTHVDIAGANYATPALDPGAASSTLKCDLTKMEKGGLDGVFLAVFVGQGPLDDAGYKGALDQAMAKFAALQRLTTQMYPNRCAFATSPAEVERIVKTGKRAIMTGVENGYPMGTDLANIRKFYDLGARYVTLSHSGNNQLADSSSAREPLNNGLSVLGKQVVVEMNRLGMMIDVSHISEKSFWDIIAITKAPIIASHSGCKVLTDNNRNLTDDQLRALAKGGGVMQTVALGSYLKNEDPARREATTKLREELGLGTAGRGGSGGGGNRPNVATMTGEQRAAYEKKMAQYQERMKEIDAKYPTATLKDFVDHIDHAVKVAGIDHVGIGTDFDGGGGILGFNDDTEAPNVTIELVRRGYTEKQIKKIWGENLLRVWREVEKKGAELQQQKA
jgi:membrane dipeptidase